ncbi:MAG: TlpA family protein disulfide reductase [Candidatus Krumholzibacteria bacterium]|nr:TlpA family protein disulfide reductase [Candidatus Krumholzibacteria bacterium]MDH4338578.1 TlpA family protein disulfide reductase [Candidatus Krumholzibacteria bacterium]
MRGGHHEKHGLASFAFAVVALAVVTAGAAMAKEPSVEGDTLRFQLNDLSGAPVGSDDPRFAGKVLYVTFWGTWCPPCITEIPTLIDLQERYREQGLVIVAVAFEKEDDADPRRARLREFVAAREINYLVLDGGQTTKFEDAFPSVKNVKGLPVEMLIDRGGGVVVSRNGYGYKKKWAAKLEKEIQALLRANEPGRTR